MITKNQIKFVRALQLKKNRDTHNCFVVEGEKMLEEILQSDFNVIEIFATKTWDFSKVKAIEVHKVSEKELGRISALKTPNKVIAIIEKPRRCLQISTIKNGFTLALDDIKNPGNLGTIIRNCDWFGVKNIICSKNSVDVYNPKVIQATMGSISRVNVYYNDIENVIEKLGNEFPIYGTFMDGENISAFNLEKNALLVMGNESFGISEKVSRLINKKIAIKRKQIGAESLNVAIATSILLYEFNR
ncbi:MAG: RNA methyltransferase [Flavobacteriales bacterium]|nr:RNA methyltransferase [Flavobacteriales bacterium]